MFNILPLLKSEKVQEFRETLRLEDSPDYSDSLCCICLESQCDVVLNCLHNFCNDCITSWSVKERSCPMCRMSLQVSQGFVLLGADPSELENALAEGMREVKDIIDSSRKFVR
mmetsp:Transcript_28048/g.50228  ORF Transcript_28048/g.50228 Transcript_28048/m.50228 type:complete len:113 (-) Transcript_28048:22-360(-)